MTFERALEFFERFMWVVLGATLGLMFTNWMKNADSWLQNWSTLVAGVLALFAGLLTVAVMIYIDEKQARRHDELVALNVRADRLKVMRTTPCLDLYRKIAIASSGILAALAPGYGIGGKDAALENVSTIKGHLASISKWGMMEKCRDLFDGDMEKDYYSLQTAFEYLKEQKGSLEVEQMVNFAEQVEPWAKTMVARLQKLIDQYDRPIARPSRV